MMEDVVSGFHRFSDGEPRLPTWAERERLAALRASGTEDVYVQPEDAPDQFSNAVLAGTFHHLIGRKVALPWDIWASEMAMALGLVRPISSTAAWHFYETTLQEGSWQGSGEVDVGVRLAAIEFLLDTVDPTGDANEFREFVNERARWFHVGVRLEGNRFVPTTSEMLHVEIVQPTLVLLADPRFADVNDLYRKGFDRALAGDASGAITAAISAVEDTLRVFFPEMADQTLGPLAEYGRAHGLMTLPVEDFVKKLYGLRDDSDAHQAGTDEFALAVLALHLAGSLILYLAEGVVPEPPEPSS